MRVLVPYTRHGPRLQVVADCLRFQQVEPELVRVDRGEAYWDLLRRSWTREFFIVEQDIIVWAGAVAEMAACVSPWCTLPTICKGREVTHSFGCVKFGQALIDSRPAFWDDMPRAWDTLDMHFYARMQDGYQPVEPCVHWPMATHLNKAHWA